MNTHKRSVYSLEVGSKNDHLNHTRTKKYSQISTYYLFFKPKNNENHLSFIVAIFSNIIIIFRLSFFTCHRCHHQHHDQPQSLCITLSEWMKFIQFIFKWYSKNLKLYINLKRAITVNGSVRTRHKGRKIREIFVLVVELQVWQ